MDVTGLRALNAITSASLLHFRSRASPPLRHPFFSVQCKPNTSHFPRSLSSSRFSALCSLSERCRADASPNGFGGAPSEVPKSREFLQVVLVSPQIPGNTGCIARTCAASAVKLHLVEVDDAKVKRAGLDYWPCTVHGQSSVNTSGNRMGEEVTSIYKERDEYSLKFTYKKGDWLVFGSETSGLPPEALLDCKSKLLGGGTIRIPMVETYVRCLNLSVSVGIALYEASRQLNYEHLQNPSEPCINSETPFLTEDIFA
ncbi:UNVERIFIED_CONTAM: putative tRNA (cytidine(34)-2'-O)-methyltransferase [Sesamum latifolium]|uniref:tRNA (Cytidine(34)-2'-O)-methyltransferase n=1 Tax=Sesamum latifolium TaxID=2727402 RepID=A0AAW2U4Y1_9LAMI